MNKVDWGADVLAKIRVAEAAVGKIQDTVRELQTRTFALEARLTAQLLLDKARVQEIKKLTDALRAERCKSLECARDKV